MTRDEVLAYRLRERDLEFQHRMMELELATTGIEPVGADPRAPVHGTKAFIESVSGSDFDALAPVIRDVHTQGYAIVPDFLTRAETESLRHALAPFFEHIKVLFQTADERRTVFEGKQTLHIQNVLAKTDAADAIAAKQTLRTILSGILGHDYIFNAGAVAMSPDPGCAPQGLHRDDGFYALIPRPHLPLVVTAAIALDDFYPDNGSTQIIPGSHLWPDDRHPEPEEVQQVEMPAGAMLLWDGALYHGGGGNRTDSTRRTLTFNYTRGWLRTQFNQYLSIPRKRILAMPPELQTDLGYHRSALGLGGCDQTDPLRYLEALEGLGGDGQQQNLGRESGSP